MNSHILTFRPVFRPGSLAGFPRRLIALVREAYRIQEERRRLAALEGQALADIGLGRAEALAEARRPIWDLPARRS